MIIVAESGPKALRTALAAGASAAALLSVTSVPAYAQQAAAGTPPVEEITVTGTRIKEPGLVSTSPLTTVSNMDITLTGTQRIEDLLNEMPQVFSGQGGNISNGSTGTSTVCLRNLQVAGTNTCSLRTLVLIDGKRLMPGDPGYNGNTPAPDLNDIPALLVDRVDLVTGGASAVYGSDAIAGVVNFIMKKDFEGIRVDSNYSFNQHSQGNNYVQSLLTASHNPQAPSDVTDGGIFDTTVIMGANSENGRGNITMYAEYRNTQPVLQNARDFSACSLNLAGATNNSAICGGSSTSYPGRFISLDNGGGSKTLGPNGTLIPYSGAVNAFNYGPYNYFQRPDDKYSLGGFGHYEVSKHADIYMDVMFKDDHTFSQVAPSGLFFGTPFAVNCDNPLLNAAESAAWCSGHAATADTNLFIGRRMIEAGPRIDDIRHTSYRVDIGSRGDIVDGWSYDVYGQYGASILSENFQNDLSINRIANSLEAVNVGGVPTCKSVVSGTDPNCVPLNIFNLSSPPNQRQLNYISIPLVTTGNTTEQIVDATINGDLGRYGLRSPLASEGFKLALGTEYRRETSTILPDLEYQIGDGAGQGGPRTATIGAFAVQEEFFELHLPLIQDKPLVKAFSIDAGYRYSDYTSIGTTDAYKIQANYSPTNDLTLRGGYNRAVRAPSTFELFQPQSLALFGGQDPCANSDVTGVPSAPFVQCARTGMTAAQYGNTIACPAAQCNNLIGGNTALKPEIADTYTAGVVLTPSFIPNFSAAIDYWDITINQAIGVVAPTVTLSQCLATGSPVFCSLIHRAPGTGVLFGTGAIATTGHIDAINLNANSLATDGIDVELNYRHDVPRFTNRDWGTLGFHLAGTYTDKLTNQPAPGLGSYNCAGLYGVTCGVPTPKWRHDFYVDWSSPWDVDLRFTWRYVGSVKADVNSPNPLLNGGFTDIFDARLPAINYFDIAGEWQITSKVRFRAGINNLFDKDPPVITSSEAEATFYNGNTYPQVYDTLGRRIFVGITLDM